MPAAAAAVSPPPGGSFTGVTPARLLDTRTGVGAPAQPVPAGGQVALAVAGWGGVPPTGVASVVVNVTVTRPAAGGYVTVYPGGAARPTASNLNFRASQTVANLVTVGLGTAGSINLFTSADAHLIADVTGWFATSDTASDRAGLFHPLRPARIADSRTGNGITTPGPNSTRTLRVTGQGGVPGSGVSAVVINVTVANPTTAGYVTAFPAGQARPTASTINFASRDVRANRAVIALGDGGISFYNAAGSTPLIIDVVGWFSDATAAPDSGGAYFVSITPTRVIDTRTHIGDLYGPLRAYDLGIQGIAGRATVPAGSGAAFPVAVVGNLTAVAPTSNGYLTAFPPDFSISFSPVPNASDLNFAAGDVVPNMIVTQLHARNLGIFNSNGTTQVVLDVSGYFALATPPLTMAPVPVGTDDYYMSLSMSRNGQHLVATSRSPDLVPGDTNNAGDAFVIDKTTGAATRVSVSTTGTQANGHTWQAGISNDGRYVAFFSSATNLVPGDTNNTTDLFVRDTVANTTTRISVGPGGVQADDFSFSDRVSFSTDGTRLAFYSAATNLVAGDTNGFIDIFVADLPSQTITRANVSTSGTQTDRSNWYPYGTISGDGNHVVFTSGATNLVPGDTNDADDVFVRDLITSTTTRENVTSDEAQSTGYPSDSFPFGALSISDNGNLVVFSSYTTDLVPSDTNDDSDVFIRDRTAGTTTRITAPGGVQANGHQASISGDGSTIAFTSSSPAMSPIWSDSRGTTMYVYRLPTGTITPVRGYDFFRWLSELTTDGTQILVRGTIDNPAANDSGMYLLTLP